jgi:hypothetical protein
MTFGNPYYRKMRVTSPAPRIWAADAFPEALFWDTRQMFDFIAIDRLASAYALISSDVVRHMRMSYPHPSQSDFLSLSSLYATIDPTINKHT